MIWHRLGASASACSTWYHILVTGDAFAGDLTAAVRRLEDRARRRQWSPDPKPCAGIAVTTTI